MSINESWWRTNLYLDADGGADTGGDNTSSDSSETGGAEEDGQSKKSEGDKLPSYFSQFKKENREKYSALSKCKSLDELAELALKGNSYKEPDYTGYLKMPTGESTKEEIQDFLSKLGVPEGPDKYTIPREDNQEPFVTGIEKTLREAAYRSGMTDSQTKNMWGVIRAVVDTAKNETLKYMSDRRKTFDERYSKLFDSYSQKAQKDAAIKESLGFFRKAISVVLQVYRSAGAECWWICGENEHLEAFQRLARSNKTEPECAEYYSGVIKLPVPSNTDEQTNAVIECTYPLPMTIQAIETRYILQEV